LISSPVDMWIPFLFLAPMVLALNFRCGSFVQFYRDKIVIPLVGRVIFRLHGMHRLWPIGTDEMV